ncbi:MAG: polyphosphate kinase 1 [Eubacterium sp.]|nr:polyphosphate kinase 1 [Eubacterium sp.]
MNENPLYMNRELSWLKFNERVLEEAENDMVPLCERLSFVSIYQSNLDEFFMVRVGALVDQLYLKGDTRENKTYMTPREQIDAILKKVRKLNRRKDLVYEELMGKLEENGVEIVSFQKLNESECEYIKDYFEHEIAPLLSPTIVGKRQPFPFLRNKEIYAVSLLRSKGGKERIGMIPCSLGIFPMFVHIPSTHKYMLTEEVILHFLPHIFSDYKVISKSLMRITRNADIDADALYDEDLDYREFMADLIKKRRKLAPVRLELSREMGEGIVKTLCKYLQLEDKYVFFNDSPLDFSFLFQIQDCLRNRSDLFYEKRVPQLSSDFQIGRPIYEQIKEKDKLLSYPYESIKPFLRMLHEAANDPNVVSIKMTLYRLSKQSKVIETLVEAAENGKEVLVLVELKARFDEENNIQWSRQLENAGCRVIYGLDGYKVHSKLCLITRKAESDVEYCTQIGTGNYNEKTSRLYTDLSYMTANVEIGLEANSVFQALDKGETVTETKHLLVAPNCLQNRVIEMIEGEIRKVSQGQEGYIGLKLNSLTDKKIIDKLIEASMSGVKIDLIIRGICCLVPGVEGKTQNIRVISIVGRFLEHSRIYIFGTGESKKIYIASADFMTRNTLRRVEVATPIYDPDLKLRVEEMFLTMLSDNVKAREEGCDGKYRPITDGDTPLNSQEYFYAMAYAGNGEGI